MLTHIDCGEGHSIVLNNDWTVWGWGENWNGELGDGNDGYMNYSSVPVQAIGEESGSALELSLYKGI